MGKGDYEFPILVTCLLILALQIHNPFQARPTGAVCHCNGDSGVAPTAGDTAAVSSSGTTPRGRAVTDEPPPVYRRPASNAGTGGAEASGGAIRPSPGAGLSTDELLRELDSIQAKAKEQQDTLAAAGRMPPPSPILQHLKDTEVEESATPTRAVPRANPSAPSYAEAAGQQAAPPYASTVNGANDAPALLRRREDFGRFLDARLPRGLGVVLGVGPRGDFATRLLSEWTSSAGVFLVDPFIHIWRGYDDPANVDDRSHQLLFEDLRNSLAPMEGRYVLVRDFSHSFGETYHSSGQAPGPPNFVYVDANHAEKAVSRDLELWWNLLSPGGILAGSTYLDDAEGYIRVRSVVDKFSARHGLQVYLTHEDNPPSWFVFKQ